MHTRLPSYPKTFLPTAITVTPKNMRPLEFHARLRGPSNFQQLNSPSRFPCFAHHACQPSCNFLQHFKIPFRPSDYCKHGYPHFRLGTSSLDRPSNFSIGLCPALVDLRLPRQFLSRIFPLAHGAFVTPQIPCRPTLKLTARSPFPIELSAITSKNPAA